MSRQRMMIYFLGLLGPIALVGMLLFAYNKMLGPITFDSTVWKAQGGQTNNNVRSRMVDDLLHHYNELKGMSQQAVVDLLGPPHTEPTPEQLAQGVEILDYGVGRRWSGESMVLYVKVEDGQVVESYVLEH